ncbi:MarR family winged helix-turn-helix transcriptional regulator [Peribacillus sp. NPDC097675]|uniref:MarR family winged helix-turn-helix transcriptional regulator n=1 Tax=Peribacillus sp. NPDC097675 TaxID=3390618 RepID=UPI003D05EF17
MRNLQELVHQFFQVSRTMTNDLNQRMADYKLTHAQLAVIEYLLKKESSSSLVDIAKYLNVEKSTVTRAVGHLEKNNYIHQVPSIDSREKRISLSDTSHDIRSKVQQTKEDFESAAFKGISNEEVDVTFQTLLKIWNNLNGDVNKQND